MRSYLFVMIIFVDLLFSDAVKDLPTDLLVEVENNLRSLFGFKQRTIDRSKIIIPETMKKMYEKQIHHPLDTTSIPRPGLNTQSANTIRSFIHIESRLDNKFKNHNKFRLKFDISNIPSIEVLKAAELSISRETFADILDEDGNNFQRIIVSDIIRPGIKGKLDPIIRLIDTKSVDVRKGGKLSLDVFAAVQRWLKHPSQNYGILLVILNQNKNKTSTVRHLRIRRDANEDVTKWNTRQPLLITYTDDGKNKQRTGREFVTMRRRRATRKPARKERETCKRHVMYVDFTHVGWSDWIVAPPGYDAYYCHGECKFPLAQHLNTTNHAIIQTFVNSVSPGKVPKACCVPTSLNSISMLYLDDENKVVLKNYKEMVVVGCGCR